MGRYAPQKPLLPSHLSQKIHTKCLFCAPHWATSSALTLWGRKVMAPPESTQNVSGAVNRQKKERKLKICVYIYSTVLHVLDNSRKEWYGATWVTDKNFLMTGSNCKVSYGRRSPRHGCYPGKGAQERWHCVLFIADMATKVVLLMSLG